MFFSFKNIMVLVLFCYHLYFLCLRKENIDSLEWIDANRGWKSPRNDANWGWNRLKMMQISPDFWKGPNLCKSDGSQQLRQPKNYQVMPFCPSTWPNNIWIFDQIRLYLKGITNQCCVTPWAFWSPKIRLVSIIWSHFIILVGFLSPICMNSL